MLESIYIADRNSRELMDEYIKNGSKGQFPEYEKYPFINELDTLLDENGKKILTACRYTKTIEADKVLKALGITTFDTTVNIDGQKTDVDGVLTGYTVACLFEGFLNGYLALLDIISGKRV